MLEIIKIDSLKIRIPKYLVNYVDDTFAEEYQKVYVKTGMIEDHVNLDKHKVNVTSGISSRIAVFNSLQGGKSEEQIVIQCNAKQLKEKYLQGITRATLPALYQYIIDLNIVYFTYETFLNAYVSDIDFCYDVKVTPKAMIEANQEIYNSVKPSCFKYVSKPFRQKTNVGMQFNTREKATPGRPYVKIYHKTLELQTKSSEFAEKYLVGQDYQDIGRLEYTIKNSKHRKQLGIQASTLNELLNIDQSKIKSIVFGGVPKYTENDSFHRSFKAVSPTDRLILMLINRCRKRGDNNSIFMNLLNYFDVATEKSRIKKKLETLIFKVDEKSRILPDIETRYFLDAVKLNFWRPNSEQ